LETSWPGRIGGRSISILGKAVSKWRVEAARHGLAKGEIDRMASAVEHDDLKAALAAR
jgi:hypothetical protein